MSDINQNVSTEERLNHLENEVKSLRNSINKTHNKVNSLEDDIFGRLVMFWIVVGVVTLALIGRGLYLWGQASVEAPFPF